MECERFLGTMLDTAAGLEAPSIQLEVHLKHCDNCSTKFHNLRRTMDLLEEWRVPEPSSRFDSRLQARLVEADASKKVSSWAPFLRPALGMGLATLLFVGILGVRDAMRPRTLPLQESELQTMPGSAVGDLKMLEEVDSVSGDSDLLDDLAVDQQDAANQK